MAKDEQNAVNRKNENLTYRYLFGLKLFIVGNLQGASIIFSELTKNSSFKKSNLFWIMNAMIANRTNQPQQANRYLAMVKKTSVRFFSLSFFRIETCLNRLLLKEKKCTSDYPYSPKTVKNPLYSMTAELHQSMVSGHFNLFKKSNLPKLRTLGFIHRYIDTIPSSISSL